MCRFGPYYATRVWWTRTALLVALRSRAAPPSASSSWCGVAGIDACAYVNIAKGRDSLIICKFDVGAVVLPGWGFVLDQGAAMKFDEWGVTTDTPVVAATLALQQAETIFYTDMDAVDGLKGV